MTYEYVQPDRDVGPADNRSWTYGQHPKTMASIPLARGGVVHVHAFGERWTPSHILVSWSDKEMLARSARQVVVDSVQTLSGGMPASPSRLNGAEPPAFPVPASV